MYNTEKNEFDRLIQDTEIVKGMTTGGPQRAPGGEPCWGSGALLP